MIRTYVNSEKETTVAVVDDFEYDAVKRIVKVMPEIVEGAAKDLCGCCGGIQFDVNAFALRHAFIQGPIKGVVKCHGEDKFDYATGENEAVKKAMNNHNKAFNRALKNWQVAILKKICSVNPGTFNQAVDEALVAIEKEKANK